MTEIGAQALAGVKFVFSALFSEDADYLPMFVQNFLLHTSGDVGLVVNLGPNSTIDTAGFSNGRVIFVRGPTARAAYGSTLLAGHIENFRAAETAYGAFQWFVPTASNALFFRPFNGEKAIAGVYASHGHTLDVRFDNLPDNWFWPKLQKFQEPGQILQSQWGIDAISSAQIEGRFASRSDWGKVADVHESVAGHWSGLELPLEEVLPITVISSIGSNRSTIICHMFWERVSEHEGRFVRISDMVERQFAPQICMMKWYRRDVNSPETLLVCTQAGQALLKILRGEAGHDLSLVQLEAISAAMLSNVAARRKELHPAEMYEVGPFEHKVKAIAARQMIGLGGGAPILGAPFIYFENTQEAVEIDLKAGADGNLTVTCIRQGTPAAEAGVQVQGYVYLPLRLKASRPYEIRATGTTQPEAVDEFAAHFVWLDGDYSAMVPAVRKIEGGDFSLAFILRAKADLCFIGVPIVSAHAASLKLSIAQKD